MRGRERRKHTTIRLESLDGKESNHRHHHRRQVFLSSRNSYPGGSGPGKGLEKQEEGTTRVVASERKRLGDAFMWIGKSRIRELRIEISRSGELKRAGKGRKEVTHAQRL